MSNEHALAEVKSLFPRQKKVNAIDVFIAARKNGDKKIHFGTNEIFDENFKLLTPECEEFADRIFKGSELSYAVCNHYNEKYGLIALFTQLYNLTRNSIGKEIVRAFIKHAISITSRYFCNNISDSIIIKDNLKFHSKDEFYAAVFDPKRIKTEMRRKVRLRAEKHLKSKLHRYDIRLDTDALQRKSFIDICEINGLTTLKPVLDEILTLRSIVDKKKAMFSIANLVRRISGPSSNKFYTSLKHVFQ